MPGWSRPMNQAEMIGVHEVGLAVGCMLGAAVLVGAAVGSEVGCSEGPVGEIDGELLGNNVVGLKLGAAGVTVGFDVGIGVVGGTWWFCPVRVEACDQTRFGGGETNDFFVCY